MNNSRIFHNTWALQQLPVTLRLFSSEWRFLICSDGKTTVDQIQKRLGLSGTEQESIVQRLCEIGVLTETMISVEDYARIIVDQAPASTEPKSFHEYLAESDVSTHAVKTPPDAPVLIEKTVPAFSPLQKPTPTPLPMSLQTVIQFILNHNADPTAGQLATYQVFMGIGTPLLKRNGITSLRFQDDRTITDPELQAVIIESIQKVLQVSCTAEMLSGAELASR